MSTVLMLATPLILVGQGSLASGGIVATFTQGDQITMQMIAETADGLGVNLTGASFSTQFRGNGNVLVTFPNGQHTVNPDQTGKTGWFTLALASADTQSIGVGANVEVVTQVTIGGQPVYFHGICQVTVLPAAPAPIGPSN